MSNITENPDGSLVVSFADRPLVLDGTKVESLVMREPTVDDQLIAEKGADGAAASEVALISNLCEISPEAVRLLKLRQYGRLQEALSRFLN